MGHYEIEGYGGIENTADRLRKDRIQYIKNKYALNVLNTILSGVAATLYIITLIFGSKDTANIILAVLFTLRFTGYIIKALLSKKTDDLTRLEYILKVSYILDNVFVMAIFIGIILKLIGWEA